VPPAFPQSERWPLPYRCGPQRPAPVHARPVPAHCGRHCGRADLQLPEILQAMSAVDWMRRGDPEVLPQSRLSAGSGAEGAIQPQPVPALRGDVRFALGPAGPVKLRCRSLTAREFHCHDGRAQRPLTTPPSPTVRGLGKAAIISNRRGFRPRLSTPRYAAQDGSAPPPTAQWRSQQTAPR
jgi:hypothetical protein